MKETEMPWTDALPRRNAVDRTARKARLDSMEMEGMEAVFSFGLPGACGDLADLEAPRGVLFGVASPRAPDADVDAGVGISGKSLSSVKSM